MQCNQCGSQYTLKHGDLEMTDAYVGPFPVKAVKYLECEGCGDLAYPPETILEIEKVRKQALEKELQSLPISDFVPAAEAAAILGISRQALHKHRRIRRGFIFMTQFAGKPVYLRKSVELFKETGDGRFHFMEPEEEVVYTSQQSRTPMLVVYVSNSGKSHIPSVFFSGPRQTAIPGRIQYAR